MYIYVYTYILCMYMFIYIYIYIHTRQGCRSALARAAKSLDAGPKHKKITKLGHIPP